MDEWYASWFGADYVSLYPHRNAAEAERQVRFLLDRIDGLEPGAPVLDLCCGAGRHTRLLAGSGFRAVGIDLSAALLARANESGRDYQLVRADMRRLPFGPVFGLVANFFTSFGYFATDDENAGILRAVASVLRPGGRFLVDYLNPDRVQSTLVPLSLDRLPDGREVEQRRSIDEETRRVEKDILIRNAHGRECRYRESVRLYSLEEMSGMIGAAGLVLDSVHGDFAAGAAYGPQAPRMVLIGSRRE